MTQAQYARHREVSREAVRKMVRDGKIPVDSRGRIDPRQADRAWSANSAGRRANPTAQAVTAATASRAASEARKAYWAALREEMAAKREAGMLGDVQEMRTAQAEAAREVRDLLRGIADRIASQLAGMSDSVAIHELLEREHAQACLAMGDAPPEAAGAPAADPAPPGPPDEPSRFHRPGDGRRRLGR